MSRGGLGDDDNIDNPVIDDDKPVISDLKVLNDNDNPLVLEMIAKHRHAFMSRAFPSGTSVPEDEDVADTQLWCRPQEELDHIVYVLSNWKPHVNLKEAEPGIERDLLAKFRREHRNGNKFKKKYHLEIIKVPGLLEERPASPNVRHKHTCSPATLETRRHHVVRKRRLLYWYYAMLPHGIDD
jgi:hypothetical protein